MNGWDLARCGRCTLRFSIEVPSRAQLADIYNRLYSEGEAYDMHLDEVRNVAKTGGKSGGGLYRSLIFLNRYKPRPGDRLLEVGCGVGTFLVSARERGWAVEGIDLSDEAVRASESLHGLPVKVGSFGELEFESGAYRAIAAWEVLEHLTDPRAFLDKTRTLLKPGGILVCSVPNEGPKVPYPAVRGPASLPPVHLNFWDRNALRRFFELNGYRVERVITQRTMLSVVSPRRHPLRFARFQAGASIGAYEGIHLFIAAAPVR